MSPKSATMFRAFGISRNKLVIFFLRSYANGGGRFRGPSTKYANGGGRFRGPSTKLLRQ